MTTTSPTALASFRAVQKLPPPPQAREVCTLSGVGDTDAWRVPTAARRPAAGWLRSTFADAPGLLRAPMLLGWRLCGAELGPLASPDHVLGWRVDLAEPARARMRLHWRVGMEAEIVVVEESRSQESGAFVLASFVAPRTRAARVVWGVLAPAHRLVTRLMLALAVRRVAAGPTQDATRSSDRNQ